MQTLLSQFMKRAHHLASRAMYGGPIGRLRRFRRLRQEFLRQNNWPLFTSFDVRPLPWYTYPATLFLQQLLQDGTKVFEWGGGNSTLFFRSYGCAVQTIDHNEVWVDYLLKRNPDLAVKCLPRFAPMGGPDDFQALLGRFREEKFDLPQTCDATENLIHGLVTEGFEAYAGEVCAAPRGFYDIIVVDGMARCLCTYLAACVISEKGYIVLDNSDRWQYNAVMRYLNDIGFGRVDFWGLGPSATRQWCTSIFSRRFDFTLRVTDREKSLGDIIATTG